MKVDFPIGTSQEAQDFELENSGKILSWISDIDYTLQQKTVTFTLSDKSVHEFTFPFSKMII